MAIVALRGIGDDAAIVVVDARPKLSTTALVAWSLSLGAVGYMFWWTAYGQKPKKRARA